MSPLDANFLHVENAVMPMHIGAISIFEGPAPAYADVVDMLGTKLALVPRYRQKVRFVPLEIARPVWIDDPHFNVNYHVRHSALPPPGSDEQLRNLVGRIMAQQLDRHKPLWELWLVEALEEGRWALLSKVHHCMVDGVSGADLMAVLFDLTPEYVPPPEPEPWTPGPEPTDADLVVDALATFALSPYEQFRALRSFARGQHGPGRLARDAASGLTQFSKTRTPPPTSLNGPIGPHRRWDWARTSLADVKKIAKAYGTSVNDVVLATIANGFRELLEHRDEPVADQVVNTFVPVSVRGGDERNEYNNKVSGMLAALPIGILDPEERLSAIHEQMRDLKESKEAVAGEILTQLAGFAPPQLLAIASRVSYRVPQRTLNTVTTNVPGPQMALYVCGCKMLEAFPYVPLGSTVRITVGIFSYNGNMAYGVTGDYETVPDIEVLCRGIENGLDELLELV